MAGRAALLAVLLLLATCAWANPISRDALGSSSTVAPAAEAPESPKQESGSSAAEDKPTVVEKADAGIASDKVPEPSVPIVKGGEEAVTIRPIDEAAAVEKASAPEIVEEAATVAPAAEAAKRVPSQQESEASETTEKIDADAESAIREETESQTKPEATQDAASDVEKSLDDATSKDADEQSPVTEVSPAEDVDERSAAENASKVEEEVTVTEAEVEVTTAITEEYQEAVEVTTELIDAVDREDATEEPVDRIAEGSSNVEVVTSVAVESEGGSFRQGEIDITEAPEEEISSTTSISLSDEEIVEEGEVTDEPSTDSPIDRVDSSTDVVYVDEKTEQPEKLIEEESIVREEVVEPEAVTDAPDAEVEESSSTDVRDEGSQDITTEGSVPEDTEVSESQTFDDAAPIKVVEVKEKVKPAENIVPRNSAPISIVEITERPQEPEMEAAEDATPAADERDSSGSESEIADTTEDASDLREEATTISSESPAIRDKQEVSSGSEQEQETEIVEEKPNDSKVKPVEISEDYWRTMVSEESASTQPSVLATEASEIVKDEPEEAVTEASVLVTEASEIVKKEPAEAIRVASEVETEASEITKEEPAEEIKEAEGAEVSVRDSAPSVDVAQPSTIDDQIAKVAQKYGLQQVGSASSEKKPVEESVSDSDDVASNVDVPKEDSIYLGNESKKSDFQESNDLTRRLSFGDKVVRFVRSYL